MKAWFRRILIASLLVSAMLAALFETATHVGRGWLRGEAFYDGRPTSFWRGHIDEWIERFDSSDLALRSMNMVAIMSKREREERANAIAVFGVPWPRPRPDTWTQRFFNTIRRAPDGGRDWQPPKALWGWYGAEAVLSDLARDAKYQPFAARALWNVKRIEAISAAGEEPTLDFVLVVGAK